MVNLRLLLDDVRDEQQDDEIKGVLLAELPLPDEAQDYDEEEVDDDCPQNLLATPSGREKTSCIAAAARPMSAGATSVVRFLRGNYASAG